MTNFLSESNFLLERGKSTLFTLIDFGTSTQTLLSTTFTLYDGIPYKIGPNSLTPVFTENAAK